MLTENKIYKELLIKSQKDIYELVKLVYDKKDSENFINNCFSYISRELDKTMIVKNINNVSFDFKDNLVINIVINDSVDYSFKANSKVLDYVISCNNKNSRYKI